MALLAMSLLLHCADLNGPMPTPTPTKAPKTVRFLALGDSYTIGESVAEPERWPNQLATFLKSQAVEVDTTWIIARTGWRTDNLMDGINLAQPDSSFNLVGLCIGVNNQYQGRPIAQYELEFRQLLARSIAHAGGRKELVFILSYPDYGYTPFGASNLASISLQVDAFNAVSKRVAEEKGIQYFDIVDISRQGLVEPDLVASDGLHPSGKQYGEWIASIQTHVFEMLER